MRLQPGQIEIISGNPAYPDFVDRIDVAEYRGATIEIGLMARYLTNAITALGSEGELELHATGATRLVRICRRGERDENATLVSYRM